MIVPNKVLSAGYAQEIRNIMFKQNTIIGLRDYSSAKVFPVAVYPIVFVVRKQKPNNLNSFLYQRVIKDDSSNLLLGSSQIVNYQGLIRSDLTSITMFFSGGISNLLEEILSKCTSLEIMAKVVGAATVSEAYEIKKIISPSVYDPLLDYKFINTGTIDRYESLWNKQDTRYLKDKYFMPVVNKQAMKKHFPNREIQASANKLIIGGMNKRLECYYDEGLTLAGKSTSIVYASKVEFLYLLGILNSKLLSYFYQNYFSGLKLQGGFFRIGPPQISVLPIKMIEETENEFSQLVGLTCQMIKAKQTVSNTPAEVEKLSRYVSYLDDEIDKLVYSIYELKEEDKQAIENSLASRIM